MPTPAPASARHFLSLAFAFISLLTGGCATTPRFVHNIVSPIIPSYHQTCDLGMRRVALLPLEFDEDMPAIPRNLDTVFRTELSKTSAFEVVSISREELSSHFGINPISSVGIIPRDLLARIVQQYGVDGVMFTDVTHYSPYMPVAIGVRCKLVDARTGIERWVFDHTFDSGDPTIAARAKDFGVDQQYEQLPIVTDGSSVLQSPAQFGKYVAHEAYRSMLGPTKG